MPVKRSETSKYLLVCEKLQENVLPTQMIVINHCNHLQKQYNETDSEIFLQGPTLAEEKEQLVQDVVAVWGKASLQVVSS